MNDVLQKCQELASLLQTKVTQNTALQDQLSAAVAENKNLAESNLSRQKDLDAREKEIKKIEDIIAFGNEAQAQAQKAKEDLKELAIQRDAFSRRESASIEEIRSTTVSQKQEQERLAKLEADLNAQKQALEERKVELKAEVLAEIKASLG